jgi:Histidine kinase-, DNA gyrase B-, and HSP90-like ATPase
VQNAIKFTPAGGRITVRAKVQETDEHYLLVEVEDSGCGLQPDVVEKVFERLYQVPTPAEAGRKGLGIGLYICKELVKRQGGKIWVTSEPGRGSRFCFTLPIASLSPLIAPLIGKLETSLYSAALFTVWASFDAGSGKAKTPPDRLCQEVRHIVQRCTLPDLDVVLPKTGSGQSGRCLVLAIANDEGAKVLAKRLREQLQHWEQSQRTGLAFSVTYTFLELPPRTPQTDGKELLMRVSRTVEALINSEAEIETAAEEVCHAQEKDSAH